jgi:serine/threonine protein kinase
MAPEQVANLEITHAADIYALGVVLFEMVTGSWPFVDKTAILTALKRLTEPAPSPRTLVPDLDAGWEATIMRCLEREPADRFQNVDDVGRALTGPASVAAVPSRPPERPASTVRRFATVSASAAVVAAAAVAISLAAKTTPTPHVTTSTPSSPPSSSWVEPAASSTAMASSPAPTTSAPQPPTPTTAVPHKSKAPAPPPSNDHAIEHFILKYPEH